MFSIIKPRGDIKSNWESVNPVLRLREWGVEWETSIGIGEVKVKIGDGITHWNDLDYSVTNDVTKKIVKTFATIPENQDNPSIEPGASLETLFGQVKRKFDYTINFMTALKNMVGDYQSKSFNTGSGTVTASDLKNAIDVLEQYKLTTANILDVNDSTNTMAALSANQGRLLKEQVTTNTSAIDLLNSNLDVKIGVAANQNSLYNYRSNLYFKYGKVVHIELYISQTTEEVFPNRRIQIDGAINSDILPRIPFVSAIAASVGINAVMNRYGNLYITSEGSIVIDNYFFSDVKEFYIGITYITR